jgi:GTP cyclohydrolase II
MRLPPATSTSESSGVVTVRTRVPLPVRRAGAPLTATLITFDGLPDQQEHFALLFDAPANGSTTAPADAAPLLRVHSECVTGDVFGSARCDCGEQLDAAIEKLAQSGGLICYLRQEGRGIGLRAKADAYTLQDQGLDTFAANEALGLPADARDYRVAGRMLLALGVSRVRLLSANPEKQRQLEETGVSVIERLPLDVPPSEFNRRYLADKRKRFSRG